MLRIASVCVLALLMGCVEDVGKDKVKAKVEDVPEATTKTDATTDGATTLKINKEKSSLKALGAKISATHPVEMHDFTGEVQVKDGAMVGLTFDVQVGTLTSDDEHLTDHLKKEDFLFVDQHPAATFKSASVKAGSEEEGMTHTVSGDLTIRGKTKRVTFPAKVKVDDSGVVASTEFTVNRQDFGITYPGKADDLVQDNVVLTIAFVAPKGS